jgi:hypothetical protein
MSIVQSYSYLVVICLHNLESISEFLIVYSVSKHSLVDCILLSIIFTRDA